MSRFSTVILILLVVAACDTERNFPLPEENYFVKFYGEEGEQEGIDFVLNPDGTIVLVGNSWRREDRSDQQIYIVKVDANGLVLWSKKIGLPNKRDFAKDVELHPDGRIVIAGETEMGIENRDVYLKTLSQDGNELDSVRISLETTIPPLGILTDEEIVSVSIISNGFIVAGASTLLTGGAIGTMDTRDAMHLRFDNSLNWISGGGTWKDTNGGVDSEDIATKVIEIIPNNLYYVFGSTNSPTFQGDIVNNYDFDFWIFQMGSAGVPNGVTLTFGDKIEDEKLSSLEVSPIELGQGYLLSGTSTRASGFSQSYVVKVTRSNSLSTTGKLVDVKPTDIGNDASGKVRIIGRLQNSYLLISNDYTLPNSGSNISLQQLSNEFSKGSNSPLIFNGGGDDFAGSVTELPDGRILIMGTMTVGQGNTQGQRKMVLMKLNPEGKLSE
jgi:hypothetical protein